MTRILATMLIAATLSGCALEPRPSSPSSAFTIATGYSCLIEEAQPGEKSNSYLCVFALDTASSYYSDSARERRINSFIAGLGRPCNQTRRWDMEDPRNTLNHDLGLIAVRIECAQ